MHLENQLSRQAPCPDNSYSSYGPRRVFGGTGDPLEDPVYPLENPGGPLEDPVGPLEYPADLVEDPGDPIEDQECQTRTQKFKILTIFKDF